MESQAAIGGDASLRLRCPPALPEPATRQLSAGVRAWLWASLVCVVWFSVSAAAAGALSFGGTTELALESTKPHGESANLQLPIADSRERRRRSRSSAVQTRRRRYRYLGTAQRAPSRQNRGRRARPRSRAPQRARAVQRRPRWAPRMSRLLRRTQNRRRRQKSPRTHSAASTCWTTSIQRTSSRCCASPSAPSAGSPCAGRRSATRPCAPRQSRRCSGCRERRPKTRSWSTPRPASSRRRTARS